MSELAKGLHWVYWVDGAMSRFGLCQVSGASPCLRVYALNEIEKIADGTLEYQPFLLRIETIMDFERAVIGWDSAPDRILRKFNRPIRKQGAAADDE